APMCAWPSAVGIYGPDTMCSASLVHPEIIVTAGHCLQSAAITTMFVGDDAYAPALEVPISSCTRHPNYELEYPDYADFMFCRLAGPLEGVPIVPILMGCEADELVPGAPAVLAGYGLADDALPEGRKRMVTTAIDYLEDTRVFFVGGTGKGTCDGDSGGPAYVKLSDGTWRVIGTTTGGATCGDWGQSELIHELVPWLEETSGIDVTPCHDADGTWAPTDACGAFPLDPDAPTNQDWGSLCAFGPTTPPSATCGPAFGDMPDVDDTTSTSDGGSSDEGSADDGPGLDPDVDPNLPFDDDPEPAQPSHGCAIDRSTPSALLVFALLLRRRRARSTR
ncbi:MAG TPA: S1 family peptidase, partial [Nannocystaceae bacterium]|nr:S1 family peptidase [Nannocystaceae bacterium]